MQTIYNTCKIVTVVMKIKKKQNGNEKTKLAQKLNIIKLYIK